MRFPSQTVTLLAIILAISAISYISCNKDNNVTSSTIIKCVTCANGGSCINDTCRGPAGYEGTSCQTEAIQKFLGNWIVSEKGSNTGIQNYSIYIENFSSLTSITINQLYYPYISNFTTPNQLSGNIAGDSIFIPTQPLYDSASIVGKGYYTPGSGGAFSTITFRYKVTNTYTGVVNDFGYSNPANSPSVWTFN